MVPRAAIDAARGLHEQRELSALLAAVVQQQRCAVAQLAAELGNSRLNYAAIVRAVLAEVAGGMMSAPEGDLMDLVNRARLPQPMYNPRLYLDGAFLAKPDAWWPAFGVAGEVDSRQWHFAQADWEHALRRHDKMAAAGIRVLHFTPIPAQIRARRRHRHAQSGARPRQPDPGHPHRALLTR
jgi:hypothetical protein